MPRSILITHIKDLENLLEALESVEVMKMNQNTSNHEYEKIKTWLL